MNKNPLFHRPGRLLLAAILLIFLLSACQPAVPQFPRETQPGLPPSGANADATATIPIEPDAPAPSPTVTPQPVEPSPTPEPVSPLGVDPADLSGVQLDFWHNSSGPALSTLHSLVDSFNASNEWGIRVNAAYQGNLDELYARVNAIESGSWPDILVAYLPQAVAWEQLHGLVNLDDYVNDPVWGMSPEVQASFYPAIWEQDRFQDRRLGLPAQRYASLLYYNQTWARQLGFDSPPTTPDEFQEQVCAAAATKRLDEDPQNDALGGWIVSTAHPAMLSWLYAFGGDMVNPGSDQDSYNFATPQSEAAFTFLRGLFDQGCAWLSADEPPEAEFAARDGLLAVGSVSGLPYQAAAFEQQGGTDQWTVLPFPSPEGEPALTIYGPSYAVATSSPERQLAAWLFLNWLLQPENQSRLIASTGSLPLDTSTRETLQEFATAHPQWSAAVDLLPLARPEPALPSWELVRWALGDAATQLFRDYFTIDRVPDLVRLLDQTADDLAVSPLTDRFLQSASPTPTP